MTTWIRFDADVSASGVTRRLREEMARLGIRSDRRAALLYGDRPQQWVSRRMTGQTEWTINELQEFCRKLGMDYVYVAAGIRTFNPTPPDGDGLLLPRMDSNHQPPDWAPEPELTLWEMRRCA